VYSSLAWDAIETYSGFGLRERLLSALEYDRIQAFALDPQDGQQNVIQPEGEVPGACYGRLRHVCG